MKLSITLFALTGLAAAAPQFPDLPNFPFPPFPFPGGDDPAPPSPTGGSPALKARDNDPSPTGGLFPGSGGGLKGRVLDLPDAPPVQARAPEPQPVNYWGAI